MKSYSSILYRIILPFFMLLFNVTISLAQDTKKETINDKKTALKNIIESKNYVFKAQTANPLRGSTRQITPDYDLRVIGDSLVTYLPYFGRAYTAPLSTSEGGIKLNTTNFEYKAVPKRKGGWEITYVPNDNRDVRQLFLSVSSNGYAQLRVTSNNRDPISFNGYMEELKKSK